MSRASDNSEYVKFGIAPDAHDWGKLKRQFWGDYVRRLQEAQSKAYRKHVAQTSATTVQMSVRMNEDVYRRFRALCKLERRTNGDMLHDLIEVYLDGG
jgi:hypothetical protein